MTGVKIEDIGDEEEKCMKTLNFMLDFFCKPKPSPPPTDSLLIFFKKGNGVFE